MKSKQYSAIKCPSFSSQVEHVFKLPKAYMPNKIGWGYPLRLNDKVSLAPSICENSEHRDILLYKSMNNMVLAKNG